MRERIISSESLDLQFVEQTTAVAILGAHGILDLE